MSFFFNDTATTEIYTLSLHDALPISAQGERVDRRRLRGARVRRRPGARLAHVVGAAARRPSGGRAGVDPGREGRRDRKSTRLNSSHANISYAVFCLKKKTIRKKFNYK